MPFLKPPRVFTPLPSPLPPRKPCTSTCNQQTQSFFLTNLPPEIRNQIYQYAFSLDASELISAKNHPLSLLLTCHKINHEATNLAFHTHSFAVTPNVRTTFVMLRNKTSHLSIHQTSAITALSYDLGKDYIHRASEVANVISNGILIFPSLSRFEIHIQRGHKIGQEIHYSRHLQGDLYVDPRKKAIEEYAPSWLKCDILRAIVRGHTFSWQAGEKWRIEWPQFDTLFFSAFEGGYWHEEPKPYMFTEAVDAVRGVHMCVCGCGDVCWLSADLVQQTGRRVLVDTVFYGAEEPAKSFEELPKSSEEQFPHLKIRLRPGVEPLLVTEGPTREDMGICSFGYEADEQYWEGLRWRNWNLGAIWREIWRGNGRKGDDGDGNGSVSLEQED